MKTPEQWIEEYKNDKAQGHGLKRNIAWTTGDLVRAIQSDAIESTVRKCANIANDAAAHWDDELTRKEIVLEILSLIPQKEKKV